MKASRVIPYYLNALSRYPEIRESYLPRAACNCLLKYVEP